MSHHSTVILVWSGGDDLAENVDKRLDEIDRGWDTGGVLHNAWVVSYPCPHDRAVGMSCEVVAVTHCDHFDAGDLGYAIRELDRTYPDEVQIFWKAEGASCYDMVFPFSGDDPMAWQ